MYVMYVMYVMVIVETSQHNGWIICQTWYLSNLLHQQIFKNIEIYPEKYVICDISDIEFLFVLAFLYIEFLYIEFGVKNDKTA